MSSHHRRRESGAVFRDIHELNRAAEKKNGPWPPLPEPKLSGYEKPSSPAERVILWTMAGVIGALTVYAIATGDRQLLIAILGVASGVLIRFARLSSEQNAKVGKDDENSS